MTREGQDGINSDAASMDHQIPVVAYYIDGPFAWTAAEIAMFPASVQVRIATRSSTRDGHVIDCETGDATPAEAAAWAHQRRVDGYAYPMVYSSISNQAAVITAFNAVGEPLPGWWLAHYDDLDVLPAGALGKQYASESNLDKSIWADYIPGVDMTDPMNDQFVVKNPDGSTWGIETQGNMIGQLFTEFFVGSGTPPWDGPSIVTQIKTLTAAQASQSAQIAALTSAVSALSTANAANQPVTVEELTAIVDRAVAQHVVITSTVQVRSEPNTPAVPVAPTDPPGAAKS